MNRQFEVREVKTNNLIGTTDKKGREYFVENFKTNNKGKYYVCGELLGFDDLDVYVGKEIVTEEELSKISTMRIVNEIEERNNQQESYILD